MEITIKTVQVTAVNAGPVNDPPLPEQGPASEVTIIEMQGEINYNTASMVEAKLSPLTQPGAKLLLDMSQVPYLSSAGLRMLLSLYRRTTSADGQIVLVGLTEEIKDTMSITGFLEFFTNCETLEEGFAALTVQPSVFPR